MRLFIGVPVSEEVKEKIRPLYEKLKGTGADFNFVSIENLHFTIKFLGDVEENKIEEIKEKFSELKSKSFQISLQKVGVFPSLERINVVWIGVQDSELLNLMKKSNKLFDYVRKNDHETEVAHLTIARVKSGKNKEQLQRVLKEVEHDAFGKMVVDKIILYESELNPEGPIYKVVEEYSLNKEG